MELLALAAVAYGLDALLAEWTESRAYRRMNEAAPHMVADALNRRTK